ncbi:MAG: hypothetical protein AAF656_08990 [Planctomycetota bacterium]
MNGSRIPGFGLGVLLTCFAIASPAHASLRQITQSGNVVTPFADNLDADLTGDGIADVTITSTTFFAGGIFQAGTTIDGQAFLSIGGSTAGGNVAMITGVDDVSQPEGTSAELGYFFPIVFSDAAYGLTDEDGIVEVFIRADDTNQPDSGVFIRRLVFDPEQRGTPGFDGKSYPEAVVPEPASALLMASWAVVGMRRGRQTPLGSSHRSSL